MIEMPTPIVQHRDGEDHVDAFNDFLSIENPTQGILCSAYVTAKGLRSISEGLRKIADVTDLYVGARNGITSKQALMTALELGLTPHIADTGTAKFIYHYKFYYVSNASHARTIVGSANLTGAGLEDNVELSERHNYYFDDYGQTAVEAYLASTMEWLRHTREENVYQVQDEAHLDRLVKNRIIVDENHSRKRRLEGVDKKAKKVVYDVPVMKFGPKKRHMAQPTKTMMNPLNGEVLVTQIGAGKRWMQANFPQAVITDYFGLELFSGESINLAPVTNNGFVEDVVPTNLVSVPSSHNFRLELPKAKGDFPKEGRPIAVYRKSADKEFRFKLYMPDDAGHDVLTDFLSDNYEGPSNQLNRVVTDANEIKTVLPSCPV